LLGVRRIKDGIFALFALIGVVLIAGPTLTGDGEVQGFIWALGSTASMAGYTLFSARMGTSSPATSGLRGTALALTVSALMQLPLATPAIPHLDAEAWWKLFITATLGVALAYSADNIAGQLTSAAVIGVLFAIDPVIGALVGALALGEILPLGSYAGICLIVISGAYIVWSANRSAIALTTRTGLLPAVPSAQPVSKTEE
ncbi:MAG: EamA family transporter, partial [Rothia sp. (in: high G+C Gram-positive bacteria)]|nr:EamA family transporter [Rothia sp. (in: high G+C Gram-positive bacteria)]